MKYVIWGCGERGKKLIKIIGNYGIEAIIDADANRQGNRYEGIPIISYEDYKARYTDCPVWVTPIKAEDEIKAALDKEGIPWFLFSEVNRFNADYLQEEDSWRFIEDKVKALQCVYLYGYNPYSLILYTLLKERGKDAKIIRDKDLDSEVSHCLSDGYKECFADFEQVRDDYVCSTDFRYNNKLKENQTINLYRLGEDTPYIHSLNAALEYEEHPFNSEKRERKITVSLTSHDERVQYVPYAIGTLMHQTLKPDRIVLYLNKDKDVQLPKALLEQMEYGVEVHYVEDLGPHTKYFYAFQEYPDDIVITIDDDRLYRLDLIEKLYNSYLKFPKYVNAMFVEAITFDQGGKLEKYTEWQGWNNGDFDVYVPNMSYSALGFGGVIYPPHCMYREVQNTENIRKACPKADDLWLKVMETLNNIPVVAADKTCRRWVVEGEIEGSQVCRLGIDNVINGRNDEQMQELIYIYNNFLPNEPSVLDKIRLNLYKK